MISLKKLVTQYTQTQDSQWQSKLMRNWDSIVGNLSQRICLEKIIGTKVIIGVYDPHWMHELLLLTPVLLNSINKGLGYAHVTQIRLVLSRHQDSPKKWTKKSINNTTIAKSVSTQKKKVRILGQSHKNAIAQVQDQELRDILIQLFNYCT